MQVSLQCVASMYGFGVSLRCFAAVFRCGVSLQCFASVFRCSASLQCFAAVFRWSVSLQYFAAEQGNYVETWEKITPNGRCATTEDIAHTALFLLSDEAQHITGQTLIVDGGWTSTSPPP